MMRLTLATVLGACAATAVAFQLGGALGGGVLAGFLLGAGMTGLGVLYQRHVLLTQPARALHALVISFLGKLVTLLFGALAFRFIEVVGDRADWRSFVIAYAAAVMIVLPLGTMDAARVLKRRRSATSDDPTPKAPVNVGN